MSVRVTGISHAAARHAVMRWHYSRVMPAARLIKLGVFEDGEFIGAVIFSAGASPHLGTAYALKHGQLCELTRVALSAHTAPVTEILRLCLSELRRISPGLRLVVSFADTSRGHHGGIYQAGNWIYTGTASGQRYVINGRGAHMKTLFEIHGARGHDLTWLRQNLDPQASKETVNMHRYLYPLDRGMRRALSARSLPYPPAQSPRAR